MRLVRTLRACSHIPARHALQWAVTGSRRTQSGSASKIKQEGGHSAAAAVRSLTGELANLHICYERLVLRDLRERAKRLLEEGEP